MRPGPDYSREQALPPTDRGGVTGSALPPVEAAEVQQIPDQPQAAGLFRDGSTVTSAIQALEAKREAEAREFYMLITPPPDKHPTTVEGIVGNSRSVGGSGQLTQDQLSKMGG